MKQNDFYEVDGYVDFIPVTINETFADSVGVTVDNYMQGYRLVVKEVYRFPKPHEPQKVTIPKFVAEWIKECKHSDWHLQKVLSNLDDDEKVGDWAYDENDDLIPEKVDMIARAWLDGFEIEQEKLYTVEIMDTILTKVTRGRNIQYKMLPSVTFPNVFDKATYTTKLTEQEIKQKDEWLWQFAKEVE